MTEATHTTDLAPVFDSDRTHGTGSLNLAQLARITKGAKRAAADDDVSLDAFEGDADLLAHGEHVFVTPGGEVVYVTATDPRTVQVVFPERAALDADGDDVLYSYETDALALIERMEADGGWKLVRRVEFVGQVNCPRCSKFMSKGRDHTGFPFAQCRCGCDVGIDELRAQDAIREVW